MELDQFRDISPNVETGGRGGKGRRACNVRRGASVRLTANRISRGGNLENRNEKNEGGKTRREATEKGWRGEGRNALTRSRERKRERDEA